MTQFEVGKRYKTRGGSIAEVIQIIDSQGDPWPMDVLIIDPPENPRRREWLSLGGCAEYDGDDNSDSLLLPAIEPEGEPTGMHPKVRQALVAMADLWMAFSGDIQTGLIDPCGGGCFLLDGARIACSYESREAALAECRQIIESIDHLLEGGAR